MQEIWIHRMDMGGGDRSSHSESLTTVLPSYAMSSPRLICWFLWFSPGKLSMLDRASEFAANQLLSYDLPHSTLDALRLLVLLVDVV